MTGPEIDELAQQIDVLTMTTSEKLAGFPFSAATKLQAALPLKMGGLGIQGAVAVQPAATFAGWWRFAVDGLTTLDIPEQLTEDWDQFPEAAVSRLCQALPAQCCLPRQWLAEKSLPAHPEPEWLSQKWWTEKIHVKASEKLRSQLCGRDLVRLQCQDFTNVGAWLRVIPSRAMGLELPPCTFQILLKWWLGQELVSTGSPSEASPPATCPFCQSAADHYGDHFVCCKKVDFHPRHEASRRADSQVLPG
jgi:hypothetical protein